MWVCGILHGSVLREHRAGLAHRQVHVQQGRLVALAVRVGLVEERDVHQPALIPERGLQQRRRPSGT